MHRFRRQRSADGFTLVELLVVVAIIALLVTILLPTLNQAKELARQAYCLNNNNMIGKGMILYTGQWGTYPYNYGFPPWGGGYYADGPNAATVPADRKERWALACIAEFMGGQKNVSYLRYKLESQFPGAFKCPSANLNAVYTAQGTDRYHGCYWTNIAIRLNRGMGTYTDDIALNDTINDSNSGRDARIIGACQGCGNWTTVYVPKPDNDPAPSAVIFSGDTRNSAVTNSINITQLAGDFKMLAGRGNVYGSLGFDRHQGKIMTGYLDGHAAAFEIKTLDKFAHFYGPSYVDAPAGDFMLRFIRSCGGSRVHQLPRLVVE